MGGYSEWSWWAQHYHRVLTRGRQEGQGEMGRCVGGIRGLREKEIWICCVAGFEDKGQPLEAGKENFLPLETLGGTSVCVLSHGQHFCDPKDCSPPGSSVLGILQARTLLWVAMPSSRGSSLLRDWTCFLHRQADSLSLVPPGKPRRNQPY